MILFWKYRCRVRILNSWNWHMITFRCWINDRSRVLHIMHWIWLYRTWVLASICSSMLCRLILISGPQLIWLPASSTLLTSGRHVKIYERNSMPTKIFFQLFFTCPLRVKVHTVVSRATNGRTCRVDRLNTHCGRLAY